MQHLKLRTGKALAIDNYFILILSCIVFIISMYLSPFYYAGDQASYTELYNSVIGKNLYDAYLLQIKLLSSYEPLYLIIAWIFAPLVDKYIFDSLLNFFLCYSFASVFLKYRAGRVFIMVFLLANFYILVMYFAADRLKLSFIFYIYCLGSFHDKKYSRSSVLLVLSVLSHLQILLFLLSTVSVLIAKNMQKIAVRFTINIKEALLITSIGILFAVSLILFREHISNKLGFYLSNNIEEIIKPSVFMMLSFFAPVRSFYIFFAFLPLIIAAFVVSGDRVVMMAYFVFLYYSVGVQGWPKLLVWVTLLYFVYKGYFFVFNFIKYGNAFL